MKLQPNHTMKLPKIFLTVLLGLFFIAPDADARGERRGGGGGGGGRPKASAPNRGGGGNSAKRSPMTGSKIERPKARPQARPASRPASRPAARPEARPAQRPAVQRPSVQKTISRPETRPGNIPDRRPEIKPGGNRPETLPGGVTRPGSSGRPDINRPVTLPGNTRPDKRPSLDRPGANRPSTLPGMVTYPNRPDKRPNIGRDQINIGDRNRVNIDKVNIGRRNMGLNRPSTLPARTRDWDHNKWGGNHGIWGNNNINVDINNNFRHNNNFSYRPNYWGARPWWGAGHCHSWHHGHWGYGWNSSYYARHWWYDDDDDFAKGFMWGIGVWSLGNLIYDMGYQSYRNPYPAPPVQNTYITYAQPVSVAAAANPPGDEQAVQLAETKSNEALERSRAAFRKGDYSAASKAVDEALGHTPADVTLHEYRALVFFALGKYSDAAGVLNTVLASGPGWSWDTMVGFYDGSGTYSDQLRKLEAYAKGAPDKADARFLLGYHYMVCGHMEKANAEFSKAAELQPADSISRQLRDLTAASIPDGGESDAEPPAKPDPVPADKLTGTWVSDRGPDGKVTFTMTDAGDYTWNFMNAGQTSELKGTYGLNDKGLLVLTSDDTQMVSAVEMKEEGKFHFTLVGAPDGDPGLEFIRN
jgi:tetratricopeptide (TPR) repeat protein